MNRRGHSHYCPLCGDEWDCTTRCASPFELAELCDECRQSAPPAERESIGFDDSSRGTGCYRRIPAPGAE